MTPQLIDSPQGAIAPRSLFRHQTTSAVLGLVFLNYIANFSSYAAFGLYEDDYLLTLPVFGWSLNDLWDHVVGSLTTWPQGRPIWWIVSDTLTFVISRLDSLPFLYVAVFISSSVSLIVLHTFLRKFLSEPASFIATALYCLYPVAQAKVIFMHQIYFYWVPILVMLLFTLYLKDRYVWFYIGSLVVLLTYEPYFLVLPFAPLLAQTKPSGTRFRELLITSSILAGLLLATLLVRHQLGDSRTDSILADPREIAMRVMTAPWVGFMTTLHASIVFPLDALKHGGASLFIEGLVALLIAYTISWGLYSQLERNNTNPKFFPGTRMILLAGAAMFFSPYLYRFISDYYPPIVDIGRLSMLHFPSAMGAVLFIGATIDFLFRRLPKVKHVILLSCAAYLALLVVFANHVQRSEYVRYWTMQQKFVRNVIEQTRDLGDGDIAIVDIETGFGNGVDARPTTPGFPPFWMVNYTSDLLKVLNQYPAGWQRPPKLFGYWKGVPATIQGDTVSLATPPWQVAGQQARMQDGNFAWLEWAEGRLIRRAAPVVVAGVTLKPKLLDEKAPIPPPSRLALMYFDLNDSPWPSMQKARNYPQ